MKKSFQTMYTCESGIFLLGEGVSFYASKNKDEEDGVVYEILVPTSCIGKNIENEDYHVEYHEEIEIIV